MITQNLAARSAVVATLSTIIVAEPTWCMPSTAGTSTKVPRLSGTPPPLIFGPKPPGGAMENIVLPVVVTDLNAVRASRIDGVLPRARSRLIYQAHQRLRRRNQIGVMLGASLLQQRHQRRLPCIRSGSCLVSTSSASGWPASRFLTKARKLV